MIIKRINDTAKASAPADNQQTSVHERVEANVHGMTEDSSPSDEEEILEPISEQNFSPGQLELQ